jgi:uncharacterized protein (TIGR00369 family)
LQKRQAYAITGLHAPPSRYAYSSAQARLPGRNIVQKSIMRCYDRPPRPTPGQFNDRFPCAPMSMSASHAAPAAFPDAPDGFEPLQRGGPWFRHLGPVYAKPAGENAIIIGLRLDERHLNVRGVAHGGMLMTLADSALGIAIHHHAAALKGVATVSMSCDFLEPAGPGDWMEAHVDIGRIGASMAFASCHLLVNGRRILRASGVFALMRK